jgi:hypothetical protein
VEQLLQIVVNCQLVQPGLVPELPWQSDNFKVSI